MPQVSSFLQERLQKERKAEVERSATRMSGDTMTSSVDSRAARGSPARGFVDDGRPQSSGGDDQATMKGMGLKAIEQVRLHRRQACRHTRVHHANEFAPQTMTTLQKTNFDLKLEIFHRREKQTELESRLKELEDEKFETDEVNERLVEELEKRDKALSEAVEMIVVLEAQRDHLLQEREMVRQVDAQGYFSSATSLGRESPDFDREPSGPATPKPMNLGLPKAGDAKVINRMPSFLTDFSENTENLRNVYLGAQDNFGSAPPTSDDAQDADSKRMRSPSLSVLSESSFSSVYGRKTDEVLSSPPELKSGLDGHCKNVTPRMGQNSWAQSSANPTDLTPRTAAHRGSNGSMAYHSINDVLNMESSPLQRLEQLKTALPSCHDESRRPSKDAGGAKTRRMASAWAPSKSKQEKRDALERVVPTSLLGPGFEQRHVLPPTPDTISTSTLRHHKTSNDTLPRAHDPATEGSYPALSEARLAAPDHSVPASRQQPFSKAAFDGRRSIPLGSSAFDTAFDTAFASSQRPQSAGETAISQHRGLSDWESDDSFDDTDGGESALGGDIWLRAGMKVDKGKDLEPMSSVSQAGGTRGAVTRVSPDLFSFPATTKGWAPDTLFKPHFRDEEDVPGGHGGKQTPAPLTRTLDALGASLRTPLFASSLNSKDGPPSAPNRRSSLAAGTAGSPSVIVGTGTLGVTPPRRPVHGQLRTSHPRNSGASSGRTRSNSIDTEAVLQRPTAAELRAGRAASVPPRHDAVAPAPLPPQQQQQQGNGQKQQQRYPPTASQAPRRPLHHLFRRSTGPGAEITAPPVSAPATQTAFRYGAPVPMVGIPSWGRRTDAHQASSLAEDERTASATPPPILRSRAGTLTDEGSGGAPVDMGGRGGGAPVGQIPGSSTMPAGMHAFSQSSGGGDGGVPTMTGAGGVGKRRWLGLGRVGSRKSTG